MTPGKKTIEEAFEAFDNWCIEYRKAHLDCELSVVELSELYAEENDDR